MSADAMLIPEFLPRGYGTEDTFDEEESSEDEDEVEEEISKSIKRAVKRKAPIDNKRIKVLTELIILIIYNENNYICMYISIIRKQNWKAWTMMRKRKMMKKLMMLMKMK